MKRAALAIREELRERIVWFEKHGKLLEAQRIKQRTEFDLEMMEEMGVCSGIENYSRHIAGRPPGSRPATVIDFFPNDYLLVIDESHATVPQIGGDVRRRPLAQDGAGRVRFPPAERAGQSPAEISWNFRRCKTRRFTSARRRPRVNWNGRGRVRFKILVAADVSPLILQTN